MHYEKFSDGTVKCIEEEIPFKVPEGWAWERFSNIASFSGGKTPSTSQDKYWGSDVLWVTSKDMKRKYINSSLLKLSIEGTASMKSYPVDTLLFVTRSNILRHSLPIAILKKPATINQDLKAATLYLPALSEYIYLCVKGMEQRLLSLYSKSGTTVEHINFDEFKKVLLPIAPEEETIRIVAAVNNACCLIDTIEQEKNEMFTVINAAKYKILDLAIRGKLAPQNPEDEPVSSILNRKDNCMLPEVLKENVNDWGFDILPKSWAVCRLEELCSNGTPTTVEGSFIDENAWILDLEDIERDTGRILKKVKKRERLAVSRKHLFFAGQVLYGKLRPYLNKVVLADEDGYCSTELLPLSFSRFISSEYARYFLMSPTFLTYATQCSYGVNMARLGTKDIKKALFPIPPLHEQLCILAAIKHIFSELDNILTALL